MGNAAAALRLNEPVLTGFILPKNAADPAAGSYVYGVSSDGAQAVDAGSGRVEALRSVRFLSKAACAEQRDGALYTCELDGAVRVYPLPGAASSSSASSSAASAAGTAATAASPSSVPTSATPTPTQPTPVPPPALAAAAAANGVPGTAVGAAPGILQLVHPALVRPLCVRVLADGQRVAVTGATGATVVWTLPPPGSFAVGPEGVPSVVLGSPFKPQLPRRRTPSVAAQGSGGTATGSESPMSPSRLSVDSQRRVRFEDETEQDVESRRSIAVLEADEVAAKLQAAGISGSSSNNSSSGSSSSSSNGGSNSSAASSVVAALGSLFGSNSSGGGGNNSGSVGGSTSGSGTAGAASGAEDGAMPGRVSATTLCEDVARGQIFVGYSNGGVAVFDAQSGRLQRSRLAVHPSPIVAMAHAVSFDVLLTCGSDGTLRALSPHTLGELCLFRAPVTALRYDRDRDVVLFGQSSGEVAVARLVPASRRRIDIKVQRRIEPTASSPITALVYSAGTDSMLTGDQSGSIRVLPNVTGLAVIAADIRPPPIASDEQADGVLEHLKRGPIEAPPPNEIPVVQQHADRIALLRQLLNDQIPESRERSEVIRRVTQTAFAFVGDQLRAFVSTFNQAVADTALWSQQALDLDAQVAELKQRQQRELDELVARHKREEDELRRSVPALRRETAASVSRLEYSLQLKRQEALNAMTRMLEGKLAEFFPRNTQLPGTRGVYQIGDPIVPGDKVAVYRAVELRSNRLVAVKVFLGDVVLAEDLQHPVLVPTVERIAYEPNVFVITPLMKESLLDYVERTQTAMPEPMCARFLFRLLRGVAYLHSRSLVHRDLRLSTVLLNDKQEPHLTHFGLMRPLTGEEAVELGQSFAAPEVLLRAVVPESDMWSIGVMMYVLLSAPPKRSVLFAGLDVLSQVTAMIETVGGKIPDDVHQLCLYCNVSPAAMEPIHSLFAQWRQGTHASRLRELVPSASENAYDLLSQLLQFNPSGRARAAEVLSHPFFVEHVANEELEAGLVERQRYLPPATPDSTGMSSSMVSGSEDATGAAQQPLPDPLTSVGRGRSVSAAAELFEDTATASGGGAVASRSNLMAITQAAPSASAGERQSGVDSLIDLTAAVASVDQEEGSMAGVDGDGDGDGASPPTPVAPAVSREVAVE